MPRIEAAEVIRRPAEDVFPYVGEPERHLEWMKTAVERRRLSEGPLEPGARFVAVNKVMGRTEHVMEVAELVPNRRVVYRSVEGPFPVTISFETESVEGGTRVSWVGEPRPGGIAGLLFPLMRRKASGQLRESLGRLKAMLEERGA